MSPRSRACRINRVASWSDTAGLPMCDPPSPIHETFYPVLPNVRYVISGSAPFTLVDDMSPSAANPEIASRRFQFFVITNVGR